MVPVDVNCEDQGVSKVSDGFGRGRSALIALAIALSVLLALVGTPVTFTVVNDAAARSVESELHALPLPDGTVLIASMSRAGKLSGNGNGMQYLGALLVRSDLSAETLQSFYDEIDTGAVSPQVFTAGGLSELHGANGFLSEPGAPDEFIVSAWGEGPGWFFESFDLRGH